MSVSSVASQIFQWAQLFAPLILAQNPKTAAIAPTVASGMVEAEAIASASGADKLQHVVNLVPLAVSAIANQTNGKVNLDPTEASTAAADAVNTAFAVAKVVQAAHGAPSGN